MKQGLSIIILSLIVSISLLGKNSEIIYGIMITGKDKFHENLARCSIKSFLNQTYPNKLLIIINDGSYTLNCDSDEIIEIKLDQKYVLGALRNKGLELIPENSLWVQWDDDDWHHHNLMEEQYNYLMSQNADLCTLQNQVQYAFRVNSAWKLSIPVIDGTVICRKKNDVWYPEEPKGEDTVFYNNYKSKYKVISWDNPEFYYIRFIHGHNTWHEAHFNLADKPKNFWNISQQEKKYLSEILPFYNF